MAQAGLVFGRYILEVGFEPMILLYQPSLCWGYGVYDRARFSTIVNESRQGIHGDAAVQLFLLRLGGKDLGGRELGAGEVPGELRAWRTASVRAQARGNCGVHTCDLHLQAVMLRSGQKWANSKHASRRNSSIFRL